MNCLDKGNIVPFHVMREESRHSTTFSEPQH